MEVWSELNCKKCNALLRSRVKFCPKCGTKVGHEALPRRYKAKSITCPSCGSLQKPTGKFCNKCGSRLKPIPISAFPGTLKKRKITVKPSLEALEEVETKIEELEGIISREKSLAGQLNSAKISLEEITIELERVTRIREKEQKEVKDLDKLTLASFKHRVKGDLEERRRKEELDVVKALASEEEIKKEWKALNKRVIRLQKDLNKVKQAKKELIEFKTIRKDVLRALTEGTTSEPITKLETSLKKVSNEFRTLESDLDDLNKGESLLQEGHQHLSKAQRELRSAGTWSTIDLFGGGLITDMVKRGKINETKSHVASAESCVREASSYLAEVDEIKIEVQMPSLFLDVFLDNIFTDLMARGKINQAQQDVAEGLEIIEQALGRVERLRNDLKNRSEGLQSEKERIQESLDHERVTLIRSLGDKVAVGDTRVERLPEVDLSPADVSSSVEDSIEITEPLQLEPSQENESESPETELEDSSQLDQALRNSFESARYSYSNLEISGKIVRTSLSSGAIKEIKWDFEKESGKVFILAHGEITSPQHIVFELKKKEAETKFRWQDPFKDISVEVTTGGANVKKKILRENRLAERIHKISGSIQVIVNSKKTIQIDIKEDAIADNISKTINLIKDIGWLIDISIA